MRICFYNWADYKDSRNLGGGVNVYQKNLMDLLQSNEDSIFFISSGVSYNILNKKKYYIRAKNNFKIINSGVVAPAHFSFNSEKQMSDPETEEIFIDIIQQIGNLDIIHFNNLEGIPISILSKIKMQFPSIKLVFSVHNYYPFCPQVNLWEREAVNCKDYNDGKKCINCINHSSSLDYYKKKYFLDESLMKLGIKIGGKTYYKLSYYVYQSHSFVMSMKKSRSTSPLVEKLSEKLPYFENRRNTFINEINKNCSAVIAVSNRVKEISISYGIKEELMRVSYIGTAHYKFFKSSQFKKNDIRTICFMGYMRKDKGFEFFLEAMEAIDNNYAKKINLVISARNINDFYFYRIKELTKKFNSVDYSNGYNHKSMNLILENVDLSVVPVLWEDNLPQVAIETHCRKIPILTSDLGGASELHGKNPLFTFKSGDLRDFLNKLYYLFDNGYDRGDYEKKSLSPKSMQMHSQELMQIYQNS